jgi:acyl-coenzyme A synthetase/AMP-(fatty) acid ligase/thioesterase domain-containing protein
MLERAGASIVVVDASQPRDAVGGRAIVTVDGDASGPPPDIAVQPGDAAYVMFTSGTSGAPKGVTIEHGALADAFSALQQHVGLEPRDIVLASTALGFDPSLRELLFPLTVGACIAITSAPLGLDPVAAARIAEDSAATVVQGTPTTLQMLLDAGWSPKGPATVWSCGDRLTTEVAEHLLSRVGTDGAVWNLYGVTENTQCAFAGRVEGAASPIPVGRPLPGVIAEVVDETFAPVPFAMDGELLLGGTGLARGYLDPTSDASFVDLPRGRRYRTGDIARWQPASGSGGELVFVGRGDSQVKLRGIRIELGELEAVLRTHPAVVDAVADVRDARLVAWAVLEPGVAVHPGELRAHAAASLPITLVPGVVAAIDAVPRTASGKVERARLTTPTATAAEPTSAGGSVPTSETERMMAALWDELLAPGRALRLDDDFFAMGGHSLLVVELAVEIDLRFGHELPITQLFDTPTLGGLSTAIDALGPPRSTTPANPETAAVTLRSGRDGAPPLFLVPGVGGTVLALHRVAPMIEYPHPVVGFEAPGHRGGPIEQTVEQLAEAYLEALHEVQPTGPVAIGGFSFGGYVAFEMACRLTAAGRDVQLALLDTGVPGGLPGGEKRTRRRRAVRRVERLRDRLLGRVDGRAARPPHLAARVRPNLTAVGNAARKAASRYRPPRGRPVTGITIVVSSKRSAETLAEGWQRVADAPTVVRVVGGRHGALLWDRTTAAAVAAILNDLVANVPTAAQAGSQAGGGPHGGRGADGRTGTGAPSASATSSQ